LLRCLRVAYTQQIYPSFIFMIEGWTHTHSCARHFAIRRDQHCRKNIIGEPQQLSLRRVSFKMYSHAGLERARYILNRVGKRDSGRGASDEDLALEMLRDT
jgi:hypothetical protein